MIEPLVGAETASWHTPASTSTYSSVPPSNAGLRVGRAVVRGGGSPPRGGRRGRCDGEDSATPSGAVPSPAAPTPSGSARGAQPTAGATPSASSPPATGPSQGTGGGTSAVLATSVCRMPGQPTGTLVFGDGQQADFAVGPQSYPAVWTWSKGRRFATRSSTITVAPGRCVRWLVTWGVRDDGGVPLPPGSYHVDARPHEVQSGAYVSTDNPVTFTVTS